MQATVWGLINHYGAGGALAGPGSPVVGQAGGELGWGRDVKGKILGKMTLTVHGKQLRGKAKLSARGCAVVESGLGDASWRRCVLSQVCRGEMKGWALGLRFTGA